MNKGMESINQS